jgi:hypothetical protein
MTCSFSITGLASPEEVAVAWQAVERYRQSNAALAGAPSPVQSLDATTAALAQRILKGLRLGPLGPHYDAMFKEWLAEADRPLPIDDLARRVGATRNEVRARLSKLSGRMKRIATPEEIATLSTPFLVLADIEYDQSNSSSHRLTAAGREAVRRYLSR